MEGRTSRPQPQDQGLRDGLQELGYIAGENLIIDRLSKPDPSLLRAHLNAYLRRHKVDLLVTLGAAETAAAKAVADKIPVLFLPVGDPVRSGFVRSLAKPETNFTGFSFYTGPENIGKQLEIFKDVVPSLRHVVAFFDRRDPSNSNRVSTVHRIASRLNVAVIPTPVNSVAEAMHGLTLLPSQEGTESGAFVICSGMFRELRGLASLATMYRLPLFGCDAFQVAEEGVLLSYAPDLYSMGYRGAWFVNQILKGVKPQQIPVESPAKFDLVINRKTAGALGLKIPPEILMLADRVFN